MDSEPWGNDDASWWHQLDLELQEREQQERVDACNRALAELDAIIQHELNKIYGSLQGANC